MIARRAVLAPLPLVLPSLLGLALGAAACGGATPPGAAAPASPASAPVATVPPPAPDVSEVPEPPLMVGVAHVKNADASMKVVNDWLKVSVLDSKAVLDELFDAEVSEVFDPTQPLDAAVSVGGSILTKPTVHAAVSVSVRSIAMAKERLEASGLRVSARPDGQWLVEGVGKGAKKNLKRPSGEGDGDEETPEAGGRPRRAKDRVVCVLTPAAPTGARLVCGESKAVDVLGPWLARTAPRKTYASDVHLELRPLAVREPMLAVRSMLPNLVKSFGGSSAGAAELDLLEAGANELADLATDVDRVTIDATLEGEGATVTTRVDHGKTTSTTAKMAVANPERAEAPPPAFWRLPDDAEMAAFGRGSDPKLLDHPRKLLSAALAEALGKTSIPEAERKAFEDLLGNRSLPLLAGPVVYGKGTSEAGLGKARALQEKAAANGGDGKADRTAFDRAKLAYVAQGFGWHVINVQEPVSKVGPLMKDWVQLWSRPALAAWKKEKGATKFSARVAVVPAALKLPKDAVHLEFVVKREPEAETQWDAKTKKMKTVKTWPVDPITFHVYAVPDAGATWLGLAFDETLLGGKLALVSGSAEGATLAKAPAFQPLRDVKASGALVATLKGFTSLARMDGDARLDKAVASLPSKGTTLLPVISRSEAPSAAAPAGASTTTIKVPRAFLQDAMRLSMQL